MDLKVSIWNMQERTNKDGEKYLGRVVCFEPGQSGRLSEAAVKPPFYVRDQQERLGKQWLKLDATTIVEAKEEAVRVQAALEAKSQGVAVLGADDLKGDRLEARISEYLDEIEINKARKSWLAYKNTLENFFLDYCKKTVVQDVTRQDIIGFKNYLKTREGVSPRSVYNHFLNTMIFFKWAKHNMEVKGGEKGDWPVKPERDAEAYTDGEIQLLMKFADTEDGKRRRDKEGKEIWTERLVLFAFLLTGFRSGELSHLRYCDIDKKISVWRLTPHNGWEPKTKAGKREVAVDDWLTKKVLDQKNGYRDTDYIFSQKRDAGKPNHKLLKVVKRVAKLAGITGRVDDHKFRSTWITNQLRTKKNTDLDIAKWAGHGDTNTLKRYYKVLQFEDEAARKAATHANEKYAGMGD